MNQLNYFDQENTIYKFKPQYTMKIIIAILIFAFVILFIKADIPVLATIFGLLGTMVIITLFSDQVVIDTQKNEIWIRQGIYMRTFNIPFEHIINFEMLTMTSLFIPAGVYLNLYFQNKNGKEKVIKVAQSMSKKQIQAILNEYDEILESHGYQGKI